jgi:3',5'-cyclic AMP phosphodiesterase CpdA
MKKYFVIVVVAVFVIFSLQVFAQSSDSGPLFSFRGVLKGILSDIEEVAQTIVSEVRNPFSSSTPAPAPSQPTSSDENSFSFAVIGDTQSFSTTNPNGNFRMAVKDIAADNPDLVLITGDLTGTCESYTECVKKHEEWKRVAAPILGKTYAAMGNHDNVGNKGVKAWQDVFNFPTNGPGGYSEIAYSFDFKNSHFVVLASDIPDEHQINGVQRNWLDQDLAKNKKENTFVIFHEPAWPVSSKIGESLDKQSGDRDALWAILKKYNVTAIFNGHEHIVSRRKVGDIYQFVFGSTDSYDHELPAAGVAEFANRGQGRFGIVSVRGKEITVKVFDPANKELNSFTFSK